MNSVRIDYDTHRSAKGATAKVSMLLWKTDYIPGCSESEHGNHVRGQVFVSTRPPKADKVVTCKPCELDAFIKRYDAELLRS